MPILPPDRTMSTRTSARLNDTKRLQSTGQQSPEMRRIKESAERRSTINMAITAGVAVAIFVIVWLLVVH